MEVRRYQPEDFAQIAAWAKEYGSKYDQTQFPEVGFIVDGLAAWFIYQTDSTVCFLENMISNKNADPELKDRALHLIVEATLKEAAALGFKVAYATTGLPAVVFRAMRSGARATTKQTLLTKQLTTGPT